MVKRLTIIKLGGSVVTNKLKPLTFNYNSVDNIAKIIKNFDGPVRIVHGAGSFGHYYAKYYDFIIKMSEMKTRILFFDFFSMRNFTLV